MRTPHRDQLFDPQPLEQRRCDHCDTTKKNLCQHDADLDQGLISRTRRRPKHCLNQYDPNTAAIPF